MCTSIVIRDEKEFNQKETQSSQSRGAINRALRRTKQKTKIRLTTQNATGAKDVGAGLKPALLRDLRGLRGEQRFKLRLTIAKGQ
jgi:hypothetical protein